MLEQFFKLVGYGLCHQLPERSLFAGGYQLPVCARDTGIYLGFVVGLVVLSVLARGTRPAELPKWPVLVLIGLFVTAMGIDGVTSYAGWRTTTNDIRLITGLVTGWGLSALTFPMVNSQLWVRPSGDRVPDGGRQVAAWLGALVGTFVVARWLLPLLGVVYPLLLVAAILITFGAVNVVFVGLIPAFERKAHRWRDAWLVFLLVQVLTFAELASAGALRAFAERLLLR